MSLQHEYGIFGGDDGAYILDFLGALRVPAVVTLHTVLDTPSPSQRTIVQKMAKAARARRDEPGRARTCWRGATSCGARASRSSRTASPTCRRAIRRGSRRASASPGSACCSPSACWDRTRAIETVIRALPALVARVSRSRLLRRRRDASGRAAPERRGLPHVARARGRAARRSRSRRVPRSVRHDRGAVQLPAGGRRLRQPVPQRGPGDERRALVRDGRGRRRSSRRPTGTPRSCSRTGAGACFPFGDSAAPGADRSRRCSTIPAELARVRAAGLRVHARLHLAAGRRAVPASSARRWRRSRARARRAARRRAPSSLPELRLDHLLRLTDDTGIIQHATFSVPARESGYCVDDNAARAHRRAARRSPERLRGHQAARRDLPGFLHAAQTPDGRFRNFMSYGRRSDGTTDRSPTTARAARSGRWARPRSSSRDEGQRMLARQMFERGLPATRRSSVRAGRR